MAGIRRAPAGLPLGLQAVLSVVAGLAQAASLAWPAGGQPLWWLQLLSMAALAWLVLHVPGQ